MAAYDKSTLTAQQLTQAVTDSVVGYKDSAKAAAETVRLKLISSNGRQPACRQATRLQEPASFSYCVEVVPEAYLLAAGNVSGQPCPLLADLSMAIHTVCTWLVFCTCSWLHCLKAAHVVRTALFTCSSEIIICIAQAAANAAAQASAAGDNAATIAQKAKEAAKQAAAKAQGTAYSASDVRFSMTCLSICTNHAELPIVDAASG